MINMPFCRHRRTREIPIVENTNSGKYQQLMSGCAARTIYLSLILTFFPHLEVPSTDTILVLLIRNVRIVPSKVTTDANWIITRT